MDIQQIRNATLKIRYGGTVFLIDPWLQDQGTGFSARALRPEMQGMKCPMDALPETPEAILEDVDCCLVTHLHFDHFSPDYLPKTIEFIAQNRDDSIALKEMGFENVRFFETDSLVVGDVTIHRTVAVHGENDSVIARMGEASGYVFEAHGEKRLYLAGDTVYCQAVSKTVDRYHPEVIILNCCGAETPLGRLIMNLADMEKVCKEAPDAIIIGTHLDSVNHATVTSDDVREYARERKLSQVHVPYNGETIKA